MKRFLAIFKDRPVEGDLLTALLSPLRLRGVFHSRWTARAPWGVAGEREDCALLHHVQEGTCLVVFPHGSAHVLADAPGRATVPLADLLPAREPGAIGTVRIDGPGPETTLLCGGLHYDASAATPLYRALPRVLVLPADVVAGQPLLRETLTRLAGEWDLAEPVLAALRHPAVAPALLAIHSRFAEPWTLRSLAAEAGLSRSAFAAVFRELVGEPPMRHLTARRMQEAARLLTTTTLPQETIARRVGYESAVGFHLAFKQWYGSTPGAFRRARSHTHQE
jgi:AraC family transcriptional activator of mtrCDE